MEMLKLEETERVINKVELMLQDCENWNNYIYIPEKLIPSWSQEVCLSCGKRMNIKDAHRVGGNTFGYGNDFYLCDSCYQKYVADFMGEDKMLL